MPQQQLLTTRQQMIYTLAFITNHSSTFLAKVIIIHCDKTLIKFVCEIIINILQGNIKITNKEPFTKFRSELEKMYNFCRRGRKIVNSSSKAHLVQQRAILSSTKGLHLLKLLYTTVQDRKFSH